MANEDIERLREKVEKDLNSKLFVPLAEEYKKAGMLEEAIDVLIKGLERNPSYMSARVSLGKIYLEKGMLKEASEEFETVVKAIPDNLYAHKKLADIYRDLGEKNKAVEALRKVQALNPADEEVARSIAELEPKFIVHPEVSKIIKDTVKDEKFPEAPVVEEEKVTEEMAAPPLKAEEAIEEVKEEEGELLEASELEALGLEVLLGPEEALKEPEITIAEEVAEELPLNVSDADSYIVQGEYEEAFNVYGSILSINPNDRHALQRMEELKALLKLLGKETDSLEVRLSKFLEGIKKRRDEFFRNP